MQALAELAVEEERWEDAQQLAAEHPDLAETVCLPWAEWLVARGSFQEARLAYRCCPTAAQTMMVHAAAAKPSPGYAAMIKNGEAKMHYTAKCCCIAPCSIALMHCSLRGVHVHVASCIFVPATICC